MKTVEVVRLEKIMSSRKKPAQRKKKRQERPASILSKHSSPAPPNGLKLSKHSERDLEKLVARTHRTGRDGCSPLMRTMADNAYNPNRELKADEVHTVTGQGFSVPGPSQAVFFDAPSLSQFAPGGGQVYQVASTLKFSTNASGSVFLVGPTSGQPYQDSTNVIAYVGTSATHPTWALADWTALAAPGISPQAPYAPETTATAPHAIELAYCLGLRITITSNNATLFNQGGIVTMCQTHWNPSAFSTLATWSALQSMPRTLVAPWETINTEPTLVCVPFAWGLGNTAVAPASWFDGVTALTAGPYGIYSRAQDMWWMIGVEGAAANSSLEVRFEAMYCRLGTLVPLETPIKTSQTEFLCFVGCMQYAMRRQGVDLERGRSISAQLGGQNSLVQRAMAAMGHVASSLGPLVQRAGSLLAKEGLAALAGLAVFP